MRPKYRYIFEDTLTGVKLASIPLYGVNMKNLLSTWGQSASYGSFTGTFRADTPGYRVQELLDATVPGRVNVWVERNGVLIWGGIVTNRVYQSESFSYQIQAQTFDAQLQGAFHAVDQAATTDDPRNAIINIWNGWQSLVVNGVTPYNYRVVIPSLVTATNPQYTYSWLASDRNASSEMITDALRAGAEYRFVYYYDQNGIRTAALQLGRWDTPGLQLGVPPGNESTTLRYPGAISNYWYSESGPQGGTVGTAIGAANGASTIRSDYTNASALALGWPAYSLKFNWNTISDQTTLNNILTNTMIQFSPPFVTPTYKIDGSDSVFGSFSLGDFIHIVISDKWRFPAGPAVFDIRVVGSQLSPATDTSVERADFTVDQPSANG